MSAAAQLAAIDRVLTLTTLALNISTELKALAQLLDRAHAEGRTISQEEMDQLDLELAKAKAAAHAAKPPVQDLGQSL